MRYISDKVISFSINVKGQKEGVRVTFTARSTGGSTFTTQYPALIEALEQSGMYGRMYRRAPECVCSCNRKRPEPKAEEKKRTTLVTHVADWQDAVEYLTGHCGCDAAVLQSPESILKEAAKCGVKFPNLAMKR